MPEPIVDLETLPVESVKVESKSMVHVSVIGTEEFNEKLVELLGGGPVWRTIKTIAEKLEVDTVALNNFMSKQSVLASRPSEKEGNGVYYALAKRLGGDKEKEKPPTTRLLVTEDDRYALASLHASLLLLDATLHKYAVELHSKSQEAFGSIATAKDKLEAGIAIFATKLRANTNKLPKV